LAAAHFRLYLLALPDAPDRNDIVAHLAALGATPPSRPRGAPASD
jgi:hypothetical protein